jgi:hypothetical protein
MNKATVLRDLDRTRELVVPFFDSDAELLRRSYGTGKWTLRQILAHLADSEVVSQARTRFILSEPGTSIVPFDQDKWTRTLLYEQRSVPLMRRLFITTRESLIELVDLLPEVLFGREGRHPEHPSYRAWDVVTRTATHTKHHYGQLVAIRDGVPWLPPSPSA